MNQATITDFYITHLYPEEMSIYGDMGNIIALKYRLNKLGFNVIYTSVGKEERLPENTDFYFIGGGQDKEQYIIFKDLINKSRKLIEDVKKGVPLLAICGGYQLLGKEFITGDGIKIEGLGLFPVKTVAPDTKMASRCIGNIIIECAIPEIAGTKLVGFENHSGRTRIVEDSDCYPLGKVLVGFGDNTDKVHEGSVYKNAIGTYLHGSCLPKNPELADYLIKKALEVKAIKSLISKPDFGIINDNIALKAKNMLINRFYK